MPKEFQYYGSISSDTMLAEDLIPKFEAVLKSFDPYWEGYPEEWTSRDEYLDSLFDEMNDLAPEGYHFGAHPGDGADFGFWPQEDFDGGSL